MYLLFVLSALFDQGDQVVHYKDSEVYQPLSSWETLVSRDGQVFILNFQDAYINHYDGEGEKLAKIGRKGKGPGEFTYATQIFFHHGKLIVYDLLENQFSVFSTAGKFEKRFSSPGQGLEFAKTATGWIYGNWAVFGMEENETALFWADEEFKQTRKIMELEDKGQGSGLWMMSDGSKTKAVFSPIDNQPKLRPSPDGSKVYMTDPNRFRITIIEANGEISHFDRADKRVPFDEEWAEGELAKRKENNPRLNKVETNFPKYFPAIRELRVNPDGNLVVDRWRGRPDDNHHPITVDTTGQKLKMAYSWELLDRLVGKSGDYVYIRTFDVESEEGRVARVMADMAERFVKENPIEFEGQAGHLISISQ